jgi:hypothetical protein
MAENFNFKSGRVDMFIADKNVINGNGLNKTIKKDKLDSLLSALKAKEFIVEKEGDHYVISAYFETPEIPAGHYSSLGSAFYSRPATKLPPRLSEIAKLKFKPVERSWSNGKKNVDMDVYVEKINNSNNTKYVTSVSLYPIIKNTLGASGPWVLTPSKPNNKANNKANIVENMNVNVNRGVIANGSSNVAMTNGSNNNVEMGGRRKHSKTKSQHRHSRTHRKTHRRA